MGSVVGPPMLSSVLGDGAPVRGASPNLLARMRQALRSRNYRRRTEQTYCHWVKRYVHCHNVHHSYEITMRMYGAVLTPMECLLLRVQDLDFSRNEILVLENGYDIRTVQELMKHNNVRTTMSYNHFLHRGGKKQKAR